MPSAFSYFLAGLLSREPKAQSRRLKAESIPIKKLLVLSLLL